MVILANVPLTFHPFHDTIDTIGRSDRSAPSIFSIHASCGTISSSTLPIRVIMLTTRALPMQK